jgi:hypothetical protein
MSAATVESIKRSHDQLVRVNPSAITVSRHTTAIVDGARSVAVSSVGPFTVRVYQESTVKSRQEQTDTGRLATEERWGLIAGPNVDLRAEPDVRDEFTIEGLGTFQVLAVHKMTAFGGLFGLQAELSRIA